jgi:hypothetical protein
LIKEQKLLCKLTAVSDKNIFYIKLLAMIQLPDIEKVAEEVHKAWMESKKAMGVHSRKSEDGEEMMVPYEKLTFALVRGTRNDT